MSINIYEPRFMLEMIKQTPPLRTVLKDTFFSTSKLFPTEKVEFDIKKGGITMAPFVNPRKGSTVLARDGYYTESYKPPLVAPKRVLTTDDLNVRLPGEALYSGYNPDQRRVELLQEDLIELDEAITRREEWMCAKVLFDGEIPVVGEGIDNVIKFDFENTIVLPSDRLWSDHENATPIDDLIMASDIVGESGFSANIVIGENEAIRHFVRNKQVKELLDIKNFQMGVVEPSVMKNGMTYYGYLAETNTYIYAYNSVYADNENINPKYPDVRPEDKDFIPAVYPIIPKGKVFVGSTDMRCKMLYGVIKDLQIGSHMSERVPKQWEQQEPSESYVKISSRPLPCPMDLNSWVILETQ